MFIYCPLVAVLTLVGMNYMDAAPTRWESTADYNPDWLSEISKILRDSIFNSTDNFYAIKKAFQPQPGSHKICITIAFNVTFVDQCTSKYLVFWTEFDITNMAGKLLVYFASSDFYVVGFDWAGACDDLEQSVGGTYTSVPTIYLVIPASFSCNDTEVQSYIHWSLLYLTKLVRNY